MSVLGKNVQLWSVCILRVFLQDDKALDVRGDAGLTPCLFASYQQILLVRLESDL